MILRKKHFSVTYTEGEKRKTGKEEGYRKKEHEL